MRSIFLLVIIIFRIVINITEATDNRINDKIVVSNIQLAGIVHMVVGNSIEILPIEITTGCPHHYHAKPSDKLRVEFSDVAIYIDDEFETFFSNLLKDYHGKIIRLSQFKSIIFNKNDGKNNWHFWLDINNVRNAVIGIYDSLVTIYPNLRKEFDANVKVALGKLSELEKEKIDMAKKINVPVVISESLAYFFDGVQNTIFIKKASNPSLNFVKILNEELKRNIAHCLVFDEHEDAESYRKYSNNIVQLDVENWKKEMHKDYANLFFAHYASLVHEMIHNCRKIP